MENNKPFFWPEGILIGLLALGGVFSVGVMMLLRPNTSEAQIRPNISVNNVSANTGTQQRIEKFKGAMLTIWQQQAQIKGFSYPVPSRFQGTIIKEAKFTQPEKVIALTFDDGPWPQTTKQVLDILKSNNIKGTFFVVGQNLKNYPELGKEIVAQGHVIANHTWHHWYHFFNQQAAAFEIDRTADLIYQVTGVKTTLFRPPGGMMHNGLVGYAKAQKYTVVMWSADSTDYKLPAVPKLINNVIKDSRPGGIVLMHDGGGNRSRTVQALPEIISNLRKQGYRFVTVPELLEIEDKEIQLLAKKK
ncbi:polysaccharide deacetylase [Nostoc linckia z18]|uniref:Polysaccharide deacetylase n=2 Tax=Nostoc linckia TaxID=92942 RepID=A0A9Q5ZBX7_NOSLI|nr:polysaccharide deacetylase family protein [Nostoc linckia]PHK41624.1 polysaccharide deacetylase [Nostoc linckia z15]PHK46118.1 polysaccharide deacetylase [Nostoc linckia z16]PHJ68405.1 polysaccharide deacetylase [Nostoc linckia z1]PHJ73840.1 polysaccharide deacetylase [Nostoc linckia z3]PHJ78410.1 polysaccharide deacetylase [Nostoc linckia z2]